MSPTVSLILATYQRTHDVTAFLNSLMVQTDMDFEVIVMDQNPDDRLQSILAPFEGKLKIRHYKLETPGVGRARGTGLAYANGPIVAVPDDDCLYAPNTVARVKSFFKENPHVGLLSGETYDRDTYPQRQVPPKKLKHRGKRGNLTPTWFTGVEYTHFFNKPAIADLSQLRFDEAFGINGKYLAAEGFDLYFRLLTTGTRGVYDPTLAIFHPVPSFVFQRKLKKTYDDNYGSGALYAQMRLTLPWESLLFRTRKMVINPPLKALLSLLGLQWHMVPIHLAEWVAVWRGYGHYLHDQRQADQSAQDLSNTSPTP